MHANLIKPRHISVDWQKMVKIVQQPFVRGLLYVPNCGHCVQPITLQPDRLSLSLIVTNGKGSTVVPIVVSDPLIQPVIPAIWMKYKNSQSQLKELI